MYNPRSSAAAMQPESKPEATFRHCSKDDIKQGQRRARFGSWQAIERPSSQVVFVSPDQDKLPVTNYTSTVHSCAETSTSQIRGHPRRAKPCNKAGYFPPRALHGLDEGQKLTGSKVRDPSMTRGPGQTQTWTLIAAISPSSAGTDMPPAPETSGDKTTKSRGPRVGIFPSYLAIPLT